VCESCFKTNLAAAAARPGATPAPAFFQSSNLPTFQLSNLPPFQLYIQLLVAMRLDELVLFLMGVCDDVQI
jgi:hypothetical protein